MRRTDAESGPHLHPDVTETVSIVAEILLRQRRRQQHRRGDDGLSHV